MLRCWFSVEECSDTSATTWHTTSSTTAGKLFHPLCLWFRADNLFSQASLITTKSSRNTTSDITSLITRTASVSLVGCGTSSSVPNSKIPQRPLKPPNYLRSLHIWFWYPLTPYPPHPFAPLHCFLLILFIVCGDKHSAPRYRCLDSIAPEEIRRSETTCGVILFLIRFTYIYPY